MARRPKVSASPPIPTQHRTLTEQERRRLPRIAPDLTAPSVLALRLLGRLGVMTTDQIGRLAFPHQHPATLRRQLNRLHSLGLIWCGSAPAVGTQPITGGRQVPIRRAALWGLLDAGRTLLDARAIEPDPETRACLISRSPHARPPARLLLEHELVRSWWLSALLSDLWASRWVSGVAVQSHYLIDQHDPIAALVCVRLSRTLDGPVAPPLLLDGMPRYAGALDVRLAFEIDQGTDPPHVLERRAARARDRHAQGVFGERIGGPVLPVVLTGGPRRAAQVAAAWREVWPDGWGVVSTLRSAAVSATSVLWGDYRRLSDASPLPLLTLLEPASTTQQMRCTPRFTPETWALGAQAEE